MGNFTFWGRVIFYKGFFAIRDLLFALRDIAGILTRTLIVSIIVILALLFYFYVWQEKHDELIDKADEVWSSEVFDELGPILDIVTFPLRHVAKPVLVVTNVVARLNKMLTKNALLKTIFKDKGLPKAAINFFKALNDMVLSLYCWLFTSSPASTSLQLMPALERLTAMVQDLVGLASRVCGAITVVAEMVGDTLRQHELSCSIQLIVNAVLGLFQEAWNFALSLLLVTFGLPNSGIYTPDIHTHVIKLIGGAQYLLQAILGLLKIIVCKLVGLGESDWPGICEDACHISCTSSCLLDFGIYPTFGECYVGCKLACTYNCTMDHEEEDHQECLETADKYVDPLEKILLQAVNIIARALEVSLFATEALGHVISGENLDYLTNRSRTEPFWDSLRDPEVWYTWDGLIEPTDYSRPRVFDYDCSECDLYPCGVTINASDPGREVFCNGGYPSSVISCTECADAFRPNYNGNVPLDRALCEIGFLIDEALELEEEERIFSFIFCRLLGAAIRLAVSIARVIINWALVVIGIFEVLINEGDFNIQFLFLYIGYEPDFQDLYRDAVYASQTIGLLIPALAGDQFMGFGIIVGNGIQIFVETWMNIYRLIGRLINEIVAAAEGFRRGVYFYMEDFFCVGLNCVDIQVILDLVMVRRLPVLYDLYRCSAIDDRWTPSNPTGNRAILEALQDIINFDVFLTGYGVILPFTLPDIACLPYFVARLVVETTGMLLSALLGALSINDYFMCQGGACAPLGNIICEAEEIINCACYILGDEDPDALGIPCMCESAEAIATGVGDIIRVVVSIARGIRNENFTEVIYSLEKLFDVATDIPATVDRDEGTVLQKLAVAIGCWPGVMVGDRCLGGSETPQIKFTKIATSFANSISFIPMVLVRLLKIFDSEGEDVVGNIFEFLRSTLEDFIEIFIGKPEPKNCTPPCSVNTRGLFQYLAELMTCFLGPIGCIETCDFDDKDIESSGFCFGDIIACLIDGLRVILFGVVELLILTIELVARLFGMGLEERDFGDILADIVKVAFELFFDSISELIGLVFDILAAIVDMIIPGVGVVFEFLGNVFEKAMSVFKFVLKLFGAKRSFQYETNDLVVNLDTLNHMQIIMDGISTGSKQRIERAGVLAKAGPDSVCSRIINAVQDQLDNNERMAIADEMLWNFCIHASLFGIYVHNSSDGYVPEDMFYNFQSFVDVLEQGIGAIKLYGRYKNQFPLYSLDGDDDGDDDYDGRSLYEMEMESKRRGMADWDASNSSKDVPRVLVTYDMDPVEFLNMQGTYDGISRYVFLSLCDMDTKSKAERLQVFLDIMNGAKITGITKDVSADGHAASNPGVIYPGKLNKIAEKLRPRDRDYINRLAGQKHIIKQIHVSSNRLGDSIKVLAGSIKTAIVKTKNYFWNREESNIDSTARRYPNSTINISGTSSSSSNDDDDNKQELTAGEALRQKLGLVRARASGVYAKIIATLNNPGTRILKNRRDLLNTATYIYKKIPGKVMPTWLADSYESFLSKMDHAFFPDDLSASCRSLSPTCSNEISLAGATIPQVNWSKSGFDCIILTNVVDNVVNLINDELLEPLNRTKYSLNGNLFEVTYLDPNASKTFSNVNFLETTLGFVTNVNTNLVKGPVGLRYWLGFIPLPIGGISKCHAEVTSHCLAGMGLSKSLSVTLLIVYAIVMFSLLFGMTPAVIMLLLSPIFYIWLVPILAYQWGPKCLSTPSSLITNLLPIVPSLFVIPNCFGEELAELFDVFNREKFNHPQELLDPADNETLLNCDTVGFSSLCSPYLYLFSFFPDLYSYLNRSILVTGLNAIHPLLCQPTNKFDHVATASTAGHRICFWWMFFAFSASLLAIPMVFAIVFLLIRVIFLLIIFGISVYLGIYDECTRVNVEDEEEEEEN